ncbi:nicotinamide riboside transporter PnuC [Deminuibacter soli]|nr:nicotinamide riboside transporter PnuC [Deminuibacter soli]
MSGDDVIRQFVAGMQQTTWPEYLAVFAGIASVAFSRAENIWVFPTGILNTVVYVYLSFHGGLYAEAGLNIYYTVMNMIGWYMWAQRKTTGEKVLHITPSNRRDWLLACSFFALMWLLLYTILRRFTNSAVPAADAFASATAYTAMLLMNKKKIENWLWWIITNIVSIPLYFIKGYVFTSVQFTVLLVLAIAGWVTWYKKQHQTQPEPV